MGSGGIQLGFDWDLSGTAWDARDRGPLGTARDRGTAWDRSGPLRTAAPDWWDWVRSVGSAASAVGSAAKRCWARQPLEMKRGPGAAAPGKEKRGSGGGSPWNRRLLIHGGHLHSLLNFGSFFITKNLQKDCVAFYLYVLMKGVIKNFST